MSDHSHLDAKYFLGVDVYNCPFCNRRNVKYKNLGKVIFHWSNRKTCQIWRVKCESCQKVSMHLTYDDLQHERHGAPYFKTSVDLDQSFFYSVPTSFFVIDDRIPKKIRALISEAEGCSKMNFLTGASACTRKAIYELLAIEKAEGPNYDDKIKHLRAKHPNIDGELFEILCHIKDITSDHVHEQSWVAWDNKHLEFFLETLKAVLHEMYVIPDEKNKRIRNVRQLHEELSKAKAGSEGKKTEG